MTQRSWPDELSETPVSAPEVDDWPPKDLEYVAQANVIHGKCSILVITNEDDEMLLPASMTNFPVCPGHKFPKMWNIQRWR